jgi:hypothetical protein
MRSSYCAKLRTEGRTEHNYFAAIRRGEAAIASDFSNEEKWGMTCESAEHKCSSALSTLLSVPHAKTADHACSIRNSRICSD